MRAHYSFLLGFALALVLACALFLAVPRSARYQFLETEYVRGDMRFPRIVVLDHYTGRAVRVYRVNYSLIEQTPPWDAQSESASSSSAAPVGSVAAQEGR